MVVSAALKLAFRESLVSNAPLDESSRPALRFSRWLLDNYKWLKGTPVRLVEMDALYRQSTAYAEGDHTVHGQHGLMGDALAHGLADVIASGAIEGWSEGHLKKRQLHLPGQQDLRGYVCVYDLVPVNIPVSSIRLHIPDFDDEKAYMMVTLPDYLFEDKDSAVSAKGNGAGYKEFAELTENVTPAISDALARQQGHTDTASVVFSPVSIAQTPILDSSKARLKHLWVEGSDDGDSMSELIDLPYAFKRKTWAKKLDAIPMPSVMAQALCNGYMKEAGDLENAIFIFPDADMCPWRPRALASLLSSPICHLPDSVVFGFAICSGRGVSQFDTLLCLTKGELVATHTHFRTIKKSTAAVPSDIVRETLDMRRAEKLCALDDYLEILIPYKRFGDLYPKAKQFGGNIL